MHEKIVLDSRTSLGRLRDELTPRRPTSQGRIADEVSISDMETLSIPATAGATSEHVSPRHRRTRLAERIRRYEEIEKHRKRPLIVYATSTRANATAMMSGDAAREFIDQIQRIPDGKEVDVLIHSSGGDALAAWKIMSVLRERFKHVAVLVPHAAFSAATIFALGADEILMHPYASLGPIDPQITVRTADGKERQFAYEDLGAFLGFLGNEVKLTEQAHITAVMDKLFAAVDPLVVGAARRASDLSAAVGARLLSMHFDGRRAQQIANNLNKSFFAHGDAVSRHRARELELKIAKDDPATETLIWNAYLGIESCMELREPFSPMDLVFADAAAVAQLRLGAPVILPANSPPQILQQVWSAVANQALAQAQAGGAAVEVPFRIISALVESTRRARWARSFGTLSPMRLPDGKVQVNITPKSTGWRTIRHPGST